MSEGSGGEIIVKGGSVRVVFDGTMYQKISEDPTVHRHDGRKIIRVEVKDETGHPVFDSAVNKEGLRWTITVFTE